jgi:ADP-ribose pyrophosphatase
MKAQRLSRRTIYESPRVNLYLDDVRFPNGLEIKDFHLLDFPSPAVAVILEDDSGQVMLARIYRYTTGKTEWELPAGGVESGESEIEAAHREVLEETGYESNDHRFIHSFYPISGIGNKVFHVVRCKAAALVRDFDPNEVSGTKWFDRDEIARMIKAGEISDGFTLTGLLLWLLDQ